MLLLNHFSHVQLCAAPWTAAHQAPLSMGFSRQGYRSGLPGPPPGDLPNPGMEPVSLTSNQYQQVGFSPLASPGKPTYIPYNPTISLRGLYPKEMNMHVHTNNCT